MSGPRKSQDVPGSGDTTAGESGAVAESRGEAGVRKGGGAPIIRAPPLDTDDSGARPMDADEAKAQPTAATCFLDCSGNGRAVMAKLTCVLCGELYREATTITECQHTFCRLCINVRIKVGTNDNRCPLCEVRLMPDPYANRQILFDRTLNNIVTKLFPRPEDGARVKEREERLIRENELKRTLSGKVTKMKAPRKVAPPAQNPADRPDLGCTKCDFAGMGCQSCQKWAPRRQPSAEQMPVLAQRQGGAGNSILNCQRFLTDAEIPENVYARFSPGTRGLPVLKKMFFKLQTKIAVSKVINYIFKKLPDGPHRLDGPENLELLSKSDVLHPHMTIREFLKGEGGVQEPPRSEVRRGVEEGRMIEKMIIDISYRDKRVKVEQREGEPPPTAIVIDD